MWPFTTPSPAWRKPRSIVAVVGGRRVPCAAYAAGRVRALEVDGPPGWWVEGGPLAVSRRRGAWAVRWPDGVTLPLRAVTAGEFTDSIRVKATLIHDGGVGPCFEVASEIVGRARLEVRVLGRDTSSAHDVTLGAGPELVLPGTLEDVEGVEGFALYSGGRELARVSARAPSASFSAEGWYDAPPEFDWDVAADQELNERLGRLTGRTSPAAADRPPPGRR
ncbi:MAG: hypothetical protein ACRC33_09005 [Gemmataceae bacterium]